MSTTSELLKALGIGGATMGASGAFHGIGLEGDYSPLDYPRQALYNLFASPMRAMESGNVSDLLGAVPGVAGAALGGVVGGPLGVLVGSGLGGALQGLGKITGRPEFKAPNVSDITGTEDFIPNALVGMATDPLTYAGLGTSWRTGANALRGVKAAEEVAPAAARAGEEVIDPRAALQAYKDRGQQRFDRLARGFSHENYNENIQRNVFNVLQENKVPFDPDLWKTNLNSPELRNLMITRPTQVDKIETGLRASLKWANDSGNKEAVEMLKNKLGEISQLKGETMAHEATMRGLREQAAIPEMDVEVIPGDKGRRGRGNEARDRVRQMYSEGVPKEEWAKRLAESHGVGVPTARGYIRPLVQSPEGLGLSLGGDMLRPGYTGSRADESALLSALMGFGG